MGQDEILKKIGNKELSTKEIAQIVSTAYSSTAMALRKLVKAGELKVKSKRIKNHWYSVYTKT